MIYVSAIILILKIINDNFKVIFCPNVCKVLLCCLCFGQCGPLVVFSIKATLLCPMEITRVPTKHPLMHASQIVWSQPNAEQCITSMDSVPPLTRMLYLFHVQARCYITKRVLEYTVSSIFKEYLLTIFEHLSSIFKNWLR